MIEKALYIAAGAVIVWYVNDYMDNLKRAKNWQFE